MLLTAIAATVVIVSWIVDPTRESAPAPPPARDTQLAQHPLIGLGGGVTVRELTQSTPFSLVALTGELAGTSIRVRAQRSDGSWGPWYQTEYETEAPDTVEPAGTKGAVRSAQPAEPIERPRSTDPVFVGATTTVQIAVTRPSDAPVTQAPAGPPPSAQPDKPDKRWPGIQTGYQGTALRAEHLRDPHFTTAGAGRIAVDGAVRGHHAGPAAQHHQPSGLGSRRVATMW